MWVLGIKPRSSERTASALNYFSPPVDNFNDPKNLFEIGKVLFILQMRKLRCRGEYQQFKEHQYCEVKLNI